MFIAVPLLKKRQLSTVRQDYRGDMHACMNASHHIWERCDISHRIWESDWYQTLQPLPHPYNSGVWMYGGGEDIAAHSSDCCCCIIYIWAMVMAFAARPQHAVNITLHSAKTIETAIYIYIYSTVILYVKCNFHCVDRQGGTKSRFKKGRHTNSTFVEVDCAQGIKVCSV